MCGEKNRTEGRFYTSSNIYIEVIEPFSKLQKSQNKLLARGPLQLRRWPGDKVSESLSSAGYLGHAWVAILLTFGIIN